MEAFAIRKEDSVKRRLKRYTNMACERELKTCSEDDEVKSTSAEKGSSGRAGVVDKYSKYFRKVWIDFLKILLVLSITTDGV